MVTLDWAARTSLSSLQRVGQEKVKFVWLVRMVTLLPYSWKQAQVFITQQIYNTRSQELKAMLQFKIPQDSPQT